MRTMALLFCSLFFFIACSDSFALSTAYQVAWQRSARKLYDLGLKYKLGGVVENGEIDCSELIRQTALRARIPGISKRRLQAWQIARGYGGFANRTVDWTKGDTQVGDLLCLHVENGLDRPDGINHMAMVVEWSGIHQVMHASGGKKRVVVIPFQKWIEDALKFGAYKRMIAGDKGG